MKKDFHLTKDGVTELESELEELKLRRIEIAKKIKSARDQGDLRENAEYQTARDEQSQVETRISDLEHILNNVEVIKNPRGKSEVSLGSTVVVTSKGKEASYQIVGSVEANPAENKISDESPFGQALLGKKIGEDAVIESPSGDIVYKIKTIS